MQLPLAFVATLAVMASFLLFLDRRLRFGQVVKRWAPVLGWSVVSGVVAIGLEIGIPDVFDSSLDKNRGWYFLP